MRDDTFNSVSCHLFSIDGRLEREIRANFEEISDVRCEREKRYLLRQSTISEQTFRKITVPFYFQLALFWLNDKHPRYSIFSENFLVERIVQFDNSPE